LQKALEDWITECIKKGTFADRDDAIEFCCASTLAFCKFFGITQETLTNKLNPDKTLGVNLFPINLKKLPLDMIPNDKRASLDDLTNLIQSHQCCINVSKETSKEKK